MPSQNERLNFKVINNPDLKSRGKEDCRKLPGQIRCLVTLCEIFEWNEARNHLLTTLERLIDTRHGGPNA